MVMKKKSRLPGIYLSNNSTATYNQRDIPEPSMSLHKTSKRGSQFLQNKQKDGGY